MRAYLWCRGSTNEKGHLLGQLFGERLIADLGLL